MAGPEDSMRRKLSTRELEVARLYARGQTYKAIARELAISPATVRRHLNAIYQKLDVSNKFELLINLPNDVSLELPTVAPVSDVSKADLDVPIRAERRAVAFLAVEVDPGDGSDAEDLYEAFQVLQRQVENIVGRFGGTIATQLDGLIVAYFGWPDAHDNDAERAVRAGVRTLEAVSVIAAEHSWRLCARAAAAFGTVVADSSSASKVTGAALRSARKMAASGPSEHLVIDANVAVLVSHAFEVEPDGTAPAVDMPQFVVGPAIETATRLDVHVSANISPFVGRQAELALLADRLRLAEAGEGQTVYIRGEPGIGKSRFAREFMAAIDPANTNTDLMQCLPFHSNTPFHVFAEYLAAMHAQYRLNGKDEIGSIFDELMVSSGAGPLETMRAKSRREQALRICVRMLVTSEEAKTRLLLVEDVHWLDPSSMEILCEILKNISMQPVLLVMTAREIPQGLIDCSADFTSINLAALDPIESLSLVDELVGPIVDNEPRKRLAERSGGIPLFIEELAQTLMWQLDQPNARGQFREFVAGNSVPLTLQQTIAMRLDSLGPARRSAQVASVIGRTFDKALLGAIEELSHAEIDKKWHLLISSKLFKQIDADGQPVLQFKHGLIQEAAYATILRAQRGELHKRVIKILERRYPNVVRAQPELLAEHCSKAGLIERAIRYFLAASERALAASAMVEATALINRGIALLDGLEQGPTRDRLELDLSLALAVPLFGMKWGTRDVEQAYLRALELSEHLLDSSASFEATRGLWHCCFTRGELATALRLAGKTIQRADSLQDDAARIVAMRALGTTHFFLGNFKSSADHVLGAISIWRSSAPSTRDAIVAGENPIIGCLAFAAYCQWFLGRADESRELINEAIVKAETTQNQYSLTMTHSMAGQLYYYARDFQAMQRHSCLAISLAEEHGFLLWGLISKILNGAGMVHQGRSAKGLHIIKREMRVWSEFGPQNNASFFPAVIAEAYASAGRLDEALSTLDTALEGLSNRNERFYMSELYRLKGVFLHQRGTSNVAVARHLHQAIAIAEEQKAVLLRQRAANDLAQLLGMTWSKEKSARTVFDDVSGASID